MRSHTSENITFPQLRWRAVEWFKYNVLHILRLDSAELVASNYERLGMSAEGGLFDEDEDDGGHCDGELNDQIHVSIFIYYNLCLFRLFSSYIIISIFLRKFCISMNMVKFFI